MQSNYTIVCMRVCVYALIAWLYMCTYIYVYVYMCVCMCISLSLSLSLSLCRYDEKKGVTHFDELQEKVAAQTAINEVRSAVLRVL